MDEKIKEVINQYELEIKNVYRARGAYMLDTTQGLRILREFRSTKAKAEMAQCVKEALRERGVLHTDVYVRNKDGDIVTENSMGNPYVLREWYLGEECNLKDTEDLKAAAGNLAALHNHMYDLLPEKLVFQSDTASEHLLKHNRELRRVRTYIKDKKQRNEFELLFLSMFSEFYHEAEEAESIVLGMDCDALYEQLEEKQWLCHGAYNYHNILMLKQGEMATTNFEKVHLQLQVEDLYDFLRKIMEKNNWNEEYFRIVVDSYQEKRMLSDLERKILYVNMKYPEKFWKIINYYFNSKKTWISGKNIEKLQGLQQQKSARRALLEKMPKMLEI